MKKLWAALLLAIAIVLAFPVGAYADDDLFYSDKTTGLFFHFQPGGLPIFPGMSIANRFMCAPLCAAMKMKMKIFSSIAISVLALLCCALDYTILQNGQEASAWNPESGFRDFSAW